MTQQCIWNKNIGDESRIIEQQHGANRDLAPTVFYLNHIPAIKYHIGWLNSRSSRLTEAGIRNVSALILAGAVPQFLFCLLHLKNLPFESWLPDTRNNHLRGVYPMMAARDSADLRLTIKYGEYGNNISPATRLLMLIKNRGINQRGFGES